MNITASVFINDDEPGLHQDYEAWLERLAPEKPYSQYHHNGYEDNADAHLCLLYTSTMTGSPSASPRASSALS